MVSESTTANRSAAAASTTCIVSAVIALGTHATSMAAVAFLCGAIAVRDLALAQYVSTTLRSEGLGCLAGLIGLLATGLSCVFVFAIGYTRYREPRPVAAALVVLVGCFVCSLLSARWLLTMKRLEWLEEPSPWRKGWRARFRTPGHIVSPALVAVAVLVAAAGTIAGWATGVQELDGLAAMTIGLVVVTFAGSQIA